MLYSGLAVDYSSSLMAKFALKLVNNWVTPLVLVSIGLHGLVLVLPMPDLAKPPEPEPELPEPEVIQVVSLPKLATGPEESVEPPLPEPEPEEEPPPPEPEEIIEEELVLTDPEVLNEAEPLPEAEPQEPTGPTNPTNGTTPDPNETELDKQLKQRESYADFSDAQTGSEYQENGSQFKANTLAWMVGKSLDFTQAPIHLQAIEDQLPSVPALACLDQNPNSWVSVVVQVSSADGSLIGEPETLNSSGYAVLNKKALEIAREADYSPYYDPANPAPGYWFNIQINYDPC